MDKLDLQNSVKDFYKNSLNKEDIEILNSLKAEPVYVEGNYYAFNLKKMGFELVDKHKDIAFAGENLKVYSKDYIIIKRDDKYGLASLVSSDIYLMCDYDQIEKAYGFRFKCFILTKGEFKYLYNIEKKAIICKLQADDIIDVIDGTNIVVLLNEKYGIYNILKNKFICNIEFDDILFYDERLIALLKDGIITIFNYVNNKVILQYKSSSDEYFIENKEKSSSNIFIINKNGQYGLIDLFSGEFLVMPEYDEVEFVECFGKNNIALLKKDGKYAIYNVLTKQFLIQCVCDSIKLSRKKLRNYIFTFEIDGKFGICNDKGAIANSVFDSISVLDEKASYIVCKTEEKCYIYSNDKLLLTLDNNDKFDVLCFENKKGVFRGTRFNDKELLCIHINNRNTMVDKIINFDIVYELDNHNGYIIKADNNKYYIYIRKNEDVYNNILKEKYYSCIEKIDDDIYYYIKNNRYGLLQGDGTMITEPKYDIIRKNSSGVIECENNGFVAYYDKRLKKVSSCRYSEIVKKDSDFLARKDGKYGIIKLNDVIVPFEYDRIIKINNNTFSKIKSWFTNMCLEEKPAYIARKDGKYAILNDKGFVMSEFIFINNINQILK